MTQQTVFNPPVMGIRKLVFEILQSGTAAPTINEIQNNFDVTYIVSRVSTGIYQLIFNKPILTTQQTPITCINSDWTKSLTGAVIGTAQLQLFQNDIATMTAIDDISAQSYVTIETYNIKNK